jgi:hypothetical protein
MGVDFAEDLDMRTLSIVTLLGSATVERLEIGLGFVCRAVAQIFSIFESWLLGNDPCDLVNSG